MPHSLNRRILELALPAFAALVAQPLFVMVDTAIVGQLGTDPLAGFLYFLTPDGYQDISYEIQRNLLVDHLLHN